jgi:putative nucleotidyltransferase with HDIG domain
VEKAKEIKNLESIITGQLYTFAGIVNSVDRDGEEESRKPITLTLQFEESRVKIKMSSWDYSALNIFKTAAEHRFICNFTFKAKPYKDSVTYNVTGIEVTEKVTSIPKELSYDETDEYKNIKEWIPQMVEDNVQNENYKKIIYDLIINNSTFFKWKAAKILHHAFPGGLALHSYMVCNNALSLANLYNGIRGFKIDYSLLVAGALLHDIGKLSEYYEDGEISFNGSLKSHMVSGVELIDDACDRCGIDKYGDDIERLKHIIISHHGKLEFGSPNQPVLPEAYIVAHADKTDAEFQAMIEALECTQTGRSTGDIKCLDGGRVFKLYTDED